MTTPIMWFGIDDSKRELVVAVVEGMGTRRGFLGAG